MACAPHHPPASNTRSLWLNIRRGYQTVHRTSDSYPPTRAVSRADRPTASGRAESTIMNSLLLIRLRVCARTNHVPSGFWGWFLGELKPPPFVLLALCRFICQQNCMNMDTPQVGWGRAQLLESFIWDEETEASILAASGHYFAVDARHAPCCVCCRFLAFQC